MNKNVSRVILKLDKVELSYATIEDFLSELELHGYIIYEHGSKPFEILIAPLWYIKNKRKKERQVEKMIYILYDANLINIKIKSWKNIKHHNKYLRKIIVMFNKTIIISKKPVEFKFFLEEYGKIIKMHKLNKKIHKVID